MSQARIRAAIDQAIAGEELSDAIAALLEALVVIAVGAHVRDGTGSAEDLAGLVKVCWRLAMLDPLRASDRGVVGQEAGR